METLTPILGKICQCFTTMTDWQDEKDCIWSTKRWLLKDCGISGSGSEASNICTWTHISLIYRTRSSRLEARLARQRERDRDRRAAEQSEARQARLERQRDHDRRADVQFEARQAIRPCRLEGRRERERERRAAKQPEARRAKLEAAE